MSLHRPESGGWRQSFYYRAKDSLRIRLTNKKKGSIIFVHANICHVGAYARKAGVI
jgi:hypothetical protein